jgi:hypothetical protein
MDWGKPQKMSVKVADFGDWIWTLNILDAKQECQQHEHDVWFRSMD